MNGQADERALLKLLERFEQGRLPTDLVRIAIELSRSSRKSKPADFLVEAYELRAAAAELVQKKREAAEKAKQKPEMHWAKQYLETRPIARRHHRPEGNPLVRFAEICDEKLLPKPRGEKGEESHIKTRQGLEKALQRYFKNAQPPPLQLGESSTADLTPEQRRTRSQAYLSRVLKEKAMPLDLLEALYDFRNPTTESGLDD